MDQTYIQPISANGSSNTSNSSNQPLQSSEREALKRTFAENGYFVVKNVVSPEKLAELHKNIVTEFDSAKQSGALFSGAA